MRIYTESQDDDSEPEDVIQLHDQPMADSQCPAEMEVTPHDSSEECEEPNKKYAVCICCDSKNITSTHANGDYHDIYVGDMLGTWGLHGKL